MDSMSTGQPNYDQVRELQRMVDRLEMQVQDLQRQVQQQGNYIERQMPALPNTSLLSPRFLSRAFAVWGHYFVASFLISIPFWCLGALLALMGALSF